MLSSEELVAEAKKELGEDEARVQVLPVRLQQVLIKPRKTAAVHWRQSEGGLLSLVNIKSDHPP